VTAAAATGIDHIEDLNRPPYEDISPMERTVAAGERASSAAAYLKSALLRPNLDLCTGALVSKIGLEEGRARSVFCERDGEAIEFAAAREIVLSAGTNGSPHLLTRHRFAVLCGRTCPRLELAMHESGDFRTKPEHQAGCAGGNRGGETFDYIVVDPVRRLGTLPLDNAEADVQYPVILQLALRPLMKEPGGLLSDPRAVYGDGGDGRAHIGSDRPVAEAHDGKVVGNRKAGMGCFDDQPLRQSVRSRDDHVRFQVHGFERAEHGSCLREVGMAFHLDFAQFLSPDRQEPVTPLDRSGALGVDDERPGIPPLPDVIRRRASHFEVRKADGAINRPLRQSPGLDNSRVAVEQLLPDTLVCNQAGKHDAVDLSAQCGIQYSRQVLIARSGDPQHGGIAAFAQRLCNGLDGIDEWGLGKAGQEDRHQPASAGRQAAGQQVGNISKVLDSPADTLGRVAGHEFAPREEA